MVGNGQNPKRNQMYSKTQMDIMNIYIYPRSWYIPMFSIASTMSFILFIYLLFLLLLLLLSLLLLDCCSAGEIFILRISEMYYDPLGDKTNYVPVVDGFSRGTNQPKIVVQFACILGFVDIDSQCLTGVLRPITNLHLLPLNSMWCFSFIRICSCCCCCCFSLFFFFYFIIMDHVQTWETDKDTFE